MAAVKKAAVKQRKAPVRKRQEPAGTGHAPDSVPVASNIAPGGIERTAEGSKVAATAANPQASRAGVIVRHAPPLTSDDGEGLGLNEISVDSLDGARAVIRLGTTESRPLSQSELISVRKLLDGAIQETY